MNTFRINSNPTSSLAYRNLSKSQFNLQTTLERLSSGLRINKASDDSAGSAINTRMSNQILSMKQANENAQQTNNLIQMAESGLNDISGMLSRMRELATQAATDTLNDSDRASINLEFQALKNEISRIAHATEYNEMNLLNGTDYKNEVHRANTTADDVRGISIKNGKLSNDIRKGIYTLSDQHVDVSDQADISNFSGTAITNIRYSASSLQPAHGKIRTLNSQVNPAEVDIINGSTTVADVDYISSAKIGDYSLRSKVVPGTGVSISDISSASVSHGSSITTKPGNYLIKAKVNSGTANIGDLSDIASINHGTSPITKPGNYLIKAEVKSGTASIGNLSGITSINHLDSTKPGNYLVKSKVNAGTASISNLSDITSISHDDSAKPGNYTVKAEVKSGTASISNLTGTAIDEIRHNASTESVPVPLGDYTVSVTEDKRDYRLILSKLKSASFSEALSIASNDVVLTLSNANFRGAGTENIEVADTGGAAIAIVGASGASYSFSGNTITSNGNTAVFTGIPNVTVTHNGTTTTYTPSALTSQTIKLASSNNRFKSGDEVELTTTSGSYTGSNSWTVDGSHRATRTSTSGSIINVTHKNLTKVHYSGHGSGDGNIELETTSDGGTNWTSASSDTISADSLSQGSSFTFETADGKDVTVTFPDSDSDGVLDFKDAYPDNADKVKDLPVALSGLSGNLQLWLDSREWSAIEKDGTNASNWIDFSGKSNHIDESTTSETLTLSDATMIVVMKAGVLTPTDSNAGGIQLLDSSVYDEVLVFDKVLTDAEKTQINGYLTDKWGLGNSVSGTLTFTNAGATGQLGPTRSQINSAYAGTDLAGKVTINTQGIQEWTVPATGTYTIQAIGAGGGAGDEPGGKGASMSGTFDLTQEHIISILVGQKGADGSDSEVGGFGWVPQGGGGGGTYVVNSSTNTILVIAGGGGGGGSVYALGHTGRDASTGTTSQAGYDGFTESSLNNGVIGPNGGLVVNGGGGGGGGYSGNGAGAPSNPVGGHGGEAFTNGGEGAGIGQTLGGFGGGGSSDYSYGGGSGGGGGYGGGSGGYYLGAGGGGSSYNDGTSQSNSITASVGQGSVGVFYDIVLPGTHSDTVNPIPADQVLSTFAVSFSRAVTVQSSNSASETVSYSYTDEEQTVDFPGLGLHMDITGGKNLGDQLSSSRTFTVNPTLEVTPPSGSTNAESKVYAFNSNAPVTFDTLDLTVTPSDVSNMTSDLLNAGEGDKPSRTFTVNPTLEVTSPTVYGASNVVVEEEPYSFNSNASVTFDSLGLTVNPSNASDMTIDLYPTSKTFTVNPTLEVTPPSGSTDAESKVYTFNSNASVNFPTLGLTVNPSDAPNMTVDLYPTSKTFTVNPTLEVTPPSGSTDAESKVYTFNSDASVNFPTLGLTVNPSDAVAMTSDLLDAGEGDKPSRTFTVNPTLEVTPPGGSSVDAGYAFNNQPVIVDFNNSLSTDLGLKIHTSNASDMTVDLYPTSKTFTVNPTLEMTPPGDSAIDTGYDFNSTQTVDFSSLSLDVDTSNAATMTTALLHNPKTFTVHPTLSIDTPAYGFDSSSSVSTSDNTIALPAAQVSELTVGDPVVYAKPNGGTVVGGLTDGSIYYVESKPSDTAITLSSTSGGSAIDLTAAGSSETGHTLTRATNSTYSLADTSVNVPDLGLEVDTNNTGDTQTMTNVLLNSPQDFFVPETRELTMTGETGVQQSLQYRVGYDTTLNFDKLGIQLDIEGSPSHSGPSADSYNPHTDSLDGKQIEITPNRDLQVGADNDVNHQLKLGISSVTASGLRIDGSQVVDIDQSRAAITSLDNATDMVNQERSYLSSMQNRLAFTMSNLTSQTQNIEASRSGIQDTDFAADAADLAKNQILAQSATAMLAQASAISQNVLGLLS